MDENKSVVDDADDWSKEPIKIEYQSFWKRGQSWRFRHRVRIAMPRPNVMPWWK
jgi:hypothetical protein